MAGLSEKEELTLLELLEKMCGYYRVALELARAEKRKFSSVAPMSEIISLMKRRRILHSCIEDLRVEVEPLRSVWDKQEEQTKHIARQMKQLLKQIEEMITESLELDQANQEMLEKRIKALALEQMKLQKESQTKGK